MLILTRHAGESIRIGEHVEITVLRIKGSQVRLGVNAPPGVRVRREELSPLGDPPTDTSDPGLPGKAGGS